MNDAELAEVVSLCSRAIYTWAGRRGFGTADLKMRLPTFAALDHAAQFRVCVLLARSRFLAADSRAGDWRFWARHHAPDGAFCGAQRRDASG